MNLKKLAKIIPPGYDSAMTVKQIQSVHQSVWSEVPLSSIRNGIKQLRKEGLPILWNTKWIYQTYNRDLIEKHMKHIDRCVKGYATWMKAIQYKLQESIV